MYINIKYEKRDHVGWKSTDNTTTEIKRINYLLLFICVNIILNDILL